MSEIQPIQFPVIRAEEMSRVKGNAPLLEGGRILKPAQKQNKAGSARMRVPGVPPDVRGVQGQKASSEAGPAPRSVKPLNLYHPLSKKARPVAQLGRLIDIKT